MAVRAKYMGNKDLSFWIRENHIGSPLGSAIWRGFRKLEPFFRQNPIWKLQTGSKIIIGKDEFAGAAGKIQISTRLMGLLHNRGIFFWASVIREWVGVVPVWKSATELHLYDEMVMQWKSILSSLRALGIYRSADKDFLIWKGFGGSSTIFVKHIYINSYYYWNLAIQKISFLQPFGNQVAPQRS